MASDKLPVVRPFVVLGALLVRAPYLVLAALLVVTAALGVAASRVKVNNSNDIFFVEDDPLLVAHRRFERRFGSDEFVMVYVEGDLYSRPGFDAVQALVEEMEALAFEGEPAFTAIASPFHAPTVRSVSGALEIAPLLANLDDPDAADLAKAKRDATEHPVYRDLLVNRDGTAGAVVGTLRTMEDDDAYQMFVAEKMEYIVDTPGLEALGALLVGNPVFKKQMDKATVGEAALFGSAAVVVSVLALFLMFRRKRQVTAAIGVVVLAVVWTVGAMGLLGFEMSLVSIILPLAIVVMGLGNGVHVINEFREQRFAGATRGAAIVQTLGVVGMPALLTAVTTAVGFLAMLTAPVVPMRELGMFAAAGVLLAYVLAVTFVPAVLAIGDDAPLNPEERKRDAAEHAAEERINARFGRIADFVVAHAPLVCIAFLALSAVLGFGLTKTVVESHMIRAFREDQEFRQAVEHVDKKLGGSTSVEIVVDSGVPGGVYDPDFLVRIESLAGWAREHEGDVVGAVLSLADLMKELNFAIAGKRELPDTRERAAQLMLLYETGKGDTRIVVDHAARRARMSIRTRQCTTKRSLALEKALRERGEVVFADWRPAKAAPLPAAAATVTTTAAASAGTDGDDVIIIDDDEEERPDPKEEQEEAADDEDIMILDEEASAATPGVERASIEKAQEAAPAGADLADDDPPLPPGAPRIEMAGTSLLFVHLAQYVVDSQVSSFALAALIIGFLMILMLRSVSLGLAAMVPNVLPILATYGFMGWTGIAVDWLTALIGVAALGVAVDGTIHIGTRYRLNRAAGMDGKAAAHAVLTSTGRAIVVTGCVLVAGFLVVTPSILSSLSLFGRLTSLCLFLALLFDIFMTPAVLAWLSPGGRAPRDARS